MAKYIRIPDEVLARKVGEELVLLNLNNEQYYGLDEVGTEMWNALTNSPDIESAKQSLLAKFDVVPEELSADLDELINKLVAEGLLEVHD